MLTFIVIVMSLLLMLSLLFWLCSPDWRQRIEEPKYRFLLMQKKDVERDKDGKKKR